MAQRPLRPASTSVSVSLHNNKSRVASGSDLASLGNFDQSEDEEEDAILPRELRDTEFRAQYARSRQERGTLLVGPQGKSRYMNGDKAKKMSYLETVFAMEPRKTPKESEKPASVRRSVFLDAKSLLTAPHNAEDLDRFHPSGEIMLALWHYYRGNVDTMVKVLYRPAVEALVHKAARGTIFANSAAENPLLFAIWYVTADKSLLDFNISN